MATSKVILLQKAVQNIALDASYRDRWTSALLVQTGLLAQYDFHIDRNTSLRHISRAIAKLDPDIDNLGMKHQ